MNSVYDFHVIIFDLLFFLILRTCLNAWVLVIQNKALEDFNDIPIERIMHVPETFSTIVSI